MATILASEWAVRFGLLLVPTVAAGVYGLSDKDRSEQVMGCFHGLNLGLMYSTGAMVK